MRQFLTKTSWLGLQVVLLLARWRNIFHRNLLIVGMHLYNLYIPPLGSVSKSKHLKGRFRAVCPSSFLRPYQVFYTENGNSKIRPHGRAMPPNIVQQSSFFVSLVSNCFSIFPQLFWNIFVFNFFTFFLYFSSLKKSSFNFSLFVPVFLVYSKHLKQTKIYFWEES